ncbi:hypothetical protein RGC59_00005 [Helicobacter pylori]|nr:hypothetical protein [Helicobacter pylori]MDZ5287238.1 hypothetical protein [Helicobacter pylori]
MKRSLGIENTENSISPCLVADCSKEWNDNLKITEYVRFELGEGIEKKAENFAEEVALQMK